MADYELYYATNRRHEGRNRWRPDRYGATFSADGSENLRFGWLRLDASASEVAERLRADCGYGRGDGNALQEYFSGRAAEGHASIEAYEERKFDPALSERSQPAAKLGFREMFGDLHGDMTAGGDTIALIHGFNVSWEDAVGTALAFQEMINRRVRTARRRVVLFTWPSNGSTFAYRSDRTDATASGYAFGRALLRLRDWFAETFDRRDPARLEACRQRLHLVCHSMGNFVLESTLRRMWEHTPGSALPRMFDQVFLCAPDVDDTTLEQGQPLYPIHELAAGVNVYYNRGDNALLASDVVKGNPDRLGAHGAARPALLHAKVQQVDCSGLVDGPMEHSYYMDGVVNEDLVRTMDGTRADGHGRRRARADAPGTWALRR